MVESVVERVFGVSKRWFTAWATVTIISSAVCYSIRPHVSFENEFTVLVNAMNVISYVMTFGLPFFLAAGISFSTEDARNRILTLISSGYSPREVFLRRLVRAFSLVLLFSVSISIVMFVEPILIGTTFYHPDGTGFLIYLLPTLITTIVFSLILVSIGALLAVVTDDVKISTVCGSLVTIGLATAVGWSSYTLWQSLTRGLAMLSPSNILRMSAGLLSGRYQQHDFFLTSYIGFEASPIAVLLAVLLLCFMAVLSVFSGVKILNRTTPFWSIQSKVRKEIWISESEQRREHIKPMREMRIRRAALVGLIILLLSSVLFFTTYYKSIVLGEATITIYESPEQGDLINLGEWFILDCNLQPSQYGLPNYLRRGCLIIDWGSAPENLTFYYALLDMQSSEFLLFNETERQSECQSRNVTEGWGGFHGSVLIQENRLYAFVMKVVATDNSTIPGVIYCSINIYQSPR